MANAKLRDSTLEVDLGNIQSSSYGPAVTSKGIYAFGGQSTSYTIDYGTTMGVNIPSSPANTACTEFFFNPISDSTSVSFSILNSAGTAQSLRYHNRIWYTSTSTYNYSNSATSINLTNQANMGYSTYTNANAEYGMWVRVRYMNFVWAQTYHNHPTFSIDYWYIGTNNVTYHGRIDGGPNALASTSYDPTQLRQHKFTFNKNCEFMVGGAF